MSQSRFEAMLDKIMEKRAKENQKNEPKATASNGAKDVNSKLINKDAESYNTIYVEKSLLSEINLIKNIKENKGPIEFIIKIGEVTEKLVVSYDREKKLKEEYSKISDFLMYFDKTYGTKHQLLENKKTTFPNGEMTECLKLEVRLPISLSKRNEIWPIFLKSKIGVIYTQVKESSLYAEITNRISESILTDLKKGYDNQSLYHDLHFSVEKREITSSIFTPIEFLKIGYGEMSLEATYAIALLIWEYAYECCLKTNLCKKISSSIQKCDDYEYGTHDITVRFRIDPKTNASLKSW